MLRLRMTEGALIVQRHSGRPAAEVDHRPHTL
jgi:hypothetical protein